MLVDHATRRGLERGGQRSRRFGNVAVDEPREPLRLVPRNHRLQQEEELILPFGEMADRRQQTRHIALLLPPYDGRRVFAGRCQVPAVARTLDLDEALRTEHIGHMVFASAGHSDGPMRVRRRGKACHSLAYAAGVRNRFPVVAIPKNPYNPPNFA